MCNLSEIKVALCLSGQIRSVEKTWFSIEKFLIKPLNCDVFLHTWKDNTGSNINLNVESFFQDKNIKLSLFEEYKTCSLKQSDIVTQSPMFYSILQSNELKKKYEQKNEFVYNIVIRSRMDCVFQEEIDYKEIIDVINNENVYYVRGESDNKYISDFKLHGRTFICDIFIFGSSILMDNLSCLYNCDNILHNTSCRDSEYKLGILSEQNKLCPKWSKIKFWRQSKKAPGKFFSNYIDEGYREYEL